MVTERNVAVGVSPQDRTAVWHSYLSPLIFARDYFENHDFRHGIDPFRRAVNEVEMSVSVSSPYRGLSHVSE